MTVAVWALFVGALMVTMVVAGTLLGRLPLSSAMVYLAVGWMLGPDVMDVLRPDPFLHAGLLERVAEVALLISLFAVGMQLGVPLRDKRWRLPARLAIVSMTVMVAMVAAIGVWFLKLPLGAAVLLGAILAPTDPVLASGVHSEPGARPDRLGFSLAGEGGLNDGTAFPFVMLGLGLLGLESSVPAWPGGGASSCCGPRWAVSRSGPRLAPRPGVWSSICAAATARPPASTSSWGWA